MMTDDPTISVHPEPAPAERAALERALAMRAHAIAAALEQGRSLEDAVEPWSTAGDGWARAAILEAVERW